MRLGITLWGFGLGYREAVDLARRTEDAGFHNLFMVESVLSNDGVTTAAMIAARTSRLLIGTNIANVYLRHPAMLAAAAVAIDEVAPERLVLGLGPNNQTMVTQAGFAWRDPRQVLQETTATLRAVFAGEGVPGLRHPRPASHAIPIHWAGMALETCAAAGIHADGLMLYINTPARYRRAVERFRRAALGAGRDADRLPVSLLIPTFIHDDLATARRAAREFLVQYARWPHYAKTFAASGYATAMERVAAAYCAGDLATAMAALDDALLDEVVLLGSPSRIREGIERFARAGVEWITLGPQAVATDALARQAERAIAALAPR
ncbi:MAG TPA: LLM class flavin-dependent oxidoreductase [Methylomirabilota bacterium]|nr:LLM class flavin-dependent oxidoreductase [Methylomirabilota bacterium]